MTVNNTTTEGKTISPAPKGLIKEVFTGKKYMIPKYQRGYRWEKINVEQLLQDIYEDILPFSNEEKEKIFDENIDEYDAIDVCKNKIKVKFDDKSYYCIQPLVVSQKAPYDHCHHYIRTYQFRMPKKKRL